MMKKTGFLLFISCWIPLFIFAQEGKKTVFALPVTVSPKIDGILDEEAWSKAPVAGEFIQRKPFNGKRAELFLEMVRDEPGSFSLDLAIHDAGQDKRVRIIDEIIQ